MAESDSLVAVIMAGGSGTRFWPLSRADKPKQYLNLLGERSLIQQTVDRIIPIIPYSHIFVCSSQQQESLLKQQLPELSGWILEPSGKNTAPCVLLSVLTLLQRGFSPDTTMVVLPADHYIAHIQVFQNLLTKAAAAARTHKGLVLLGIVPDQPHTGYGYIEAGDTVGGEVRKVQRFVEKPDRARAEAFLKSGGFWWNSGIFIWRLGTIAEALQKYLPAEWELLHNVRTPRELAQAYDKLTAAPIDVAVLEKASNTLVIPADMGWSDIGSWDALYQMRRSPETGHAVMAGEVGSIDSRGCLVLANGKKVALVGVEDLIIVEDGDTLLIASRAQDQKVRQAAKQFDKS